MFHTRYLSGSNMMFLLLYILVQHLSYIHVVHNNYKGTKISLMELKFDALAVTTVKNLDQAIDNFLMAGKLDDSKNGHLNIHNHIVFENPTLNRKISKSAEAKCCKIEY
jgi:hypothetical protein